MKRTLLFFILFFSFVRPSYSEGSDERVLNIIFVVNSGKRTEDDGSKNEVGLTLAQKNSFYSNIEEWTKDNFLLYFANARQPETTIKNSEVNDLIELFEKSGQTEQSDFSFDKSTLLTQLKSMSMFGIQRVVFHVYAAESYLYDNVIIKSSGINNFISIMPKEILKVLNIAPVDGIATNFDFVFYTSLPNVTVQKDIEKKLNDKMSYYNRGIFLAEYKKTILNLTN
jgi:hypothetical protein